MDIYDEPLCDIKIDFCNYYDDFCEDVTYCQEKDIDGCAWCKSKESL